MTTLRGRLTMWYAGALVLALAAFAASLYLELQKPSELELDERIALEASLAVRWLEDSHRVLGRLVRTDTGIATPLDSAPGIDLGQTSTLSPSIGAYFEAFRDYVMVVDRRGNILFLSESARGIGFAAIDQLASQISPSQQAVTADLVAELTRNHSRRMNARGLTA